MHPIHARRIGDRPWGWRDAVVTGVVDGEIRLRYVHETGYPVVWHHNDLSALLNAGTPVQLHEGYHGLGLPAGWVNVIIRSGGLGAVPEPEVTGT